MLIVELNLSVHLIPIFESKAFGSLLNGKGTTKTD